MLPQLEFHKVLSKSVTELLDQVLCICLSPACTRKCSKKSKQPHQQYRTTTGNKWYQQEWETHHQHPLKAVSGISPSATCKTRKSNSVILFKEKKQKRRKVNYRNQALEWPTHGHHIVSFLQRTVTHASEPFSILLTGGIPW